MDKKPILCNSSSPNFYKLDSTKSGNYYFFGTKFVSESIFLVTKIKFGIDFWYEFDEVKNNFELLVTFGMSLEGVCKELDT
jgi:hypothetical protein